MSLMDKLKGAPSVSAPPNSPLWKGPTEDGVSYSLLSRFLVCRERFRLLVIEGLQPPESFSPAIDFGTMWHSAEEAFAAAPAKGYHAGSPHNAALLGAAQELAHKYPTEQDKVLHWYTMAKVMFPRYIDHWKTHPDVKSRTPVEQEKVFNVKYRLPSGRTVKLKGKRDSVDRIVTKEGEGVYIQENKTKSRIDDAKIERQLSFDLQTMIYLVALISEKETPGHPLRGMTIKGVRYNVIRRPAHHPGKKESLADFEARFADVVDEAPEDFFARWRVDISPADVVKFLTETLDPVLEQLCDWWDHILNCIHSGNSPFHQSASKGDPKGIHWRHPFGVWNILDEGGASELDEYLKTGSKVGLTHTTNLFPELS